MHDDMTTEAVAVAPVSYRLFGAEGSAYSDKLRMYMCYRGAHFEWVERNAASEAEVQALASFQTLPVLLTPSGHAARDSTQLIAALEADLPGASVIPEHGGLRLIATILEDYADSWLTKAVMHYRWVRKKDAKLAARRAVDAYYPPDHEGIDRKALAETAIEKMNASLSLIGGDPEWAPVVEKSFKRLITCLDPLLRKRAFLLGERPSIADFALAGQLRQALKDPTPARVIAKSGPAVRAWCEERMGGADFSSKDGAFASFADIADDLAPLFTEEICAVYLPWADANHRANMMRLPQMEVVLGRKSALRHRRLRSASRSFHEVRRAFSACTDEEALGFLQKMGAHTYLLRPKKNRTTDTDDGEPRQNAVTAVGKVPDGGEQA